jgi:ATP-binding cassette subfamily C protein CydD
VLSAQYLQRRNVLESRQLELLHHAPELRALGAVTYGANEIAAISDSEHVIALRAIRVALESSLVTEFLSGVSIGLVAMVVGFGLLDGRLDLFHALVAVLVTAELFLHVRRYGAEFHRREDAAASLFLLQDVETTASTPSTHCWSLPNWSVTPSAIPST